MQWLFRFWRSTIGAKVVMALTGAVLYGFVIFHMAGNMNVFLGREAMLDYTELLHMSEEVVWLVRIVLLSCVVGHIASFVSLMGRTNAARPVGYQKKQDRAATLYSKTMRLSGVVVLGFIVWHLLHLTVGTVGDVKFHPDYRWAGHVADAYHNLTTGLAVPWMGGIYIFCNILLGFHLFHGSFSLFKTLGLAGEKHLRLARAVSYVLSSAVVGGNVAIAAAIVFGLVKPA